MTDYAFDPMPRPAVPVRSGAPFPVRRIFCVGKNYVDHVKEMGGDACKHPPVFFTKPADAVVVNGASVPYPQGTDNLHYEGELVIALGSGGRNISESNAQQAIFGYAAGCDLTRRDLQQQAKEAGNPWDIAKAFDHSAPISEIVKADEIDLSNGVLSLQTNGTVRQHVCFNMMIWTIPQIIAKLSTLFELNAGDLIFTGTPKGVGPLSIGDTVSVEITGLTSLTFEMTA